MTKRIATFLYASLVLLGLFFPLTNSVSQPVAQGSESMICPACSDKQADGTCKDRRVCAPGKKMNPANSCQCECSIQYGPPYTTNPSTCERECLPIPPCSGGKVQNQDTCQCDCPISKLNCSACPEGQYFDGTKCKCPGAQYLDGTVCKSCPAGQYFNGVVCTSCTGGQYLSGTVCKCPDGQYFDGTTCRCPGGQSLVGTVCKCPTGQYFDGTVCKSCTGGQVVSGNGCVCPVVGQSLVGGVCRCTGGQSLVGGVCQCPTDQALVGGVCQCTGGRSLVGGVCKCSATQYFDGAACRSCTGGQVVVGNRCQCPVGQSLVGGVCKRDCSFNWGCQDAGTGCNPGYSDPNKNCPGKGSIGHNATLSRIEHYRSIRGTGYLWSTNPAAENVSCFSHGISIWQCNDGTLIKIRDASPPPPPRCSGGPIKIHGRNNMSNVFGTGYNDSNGILYANNEIYEVCKIALNAAAWSDVVPFDGKRVTFSSPYNNQICSFAPNSATEKRCVNAGAAGNPGYVNEVQCRCK